MPVFENGVQFPDHDLGAEAARTRLEKAAQPVGGLVMEAATAETPDTSVHYGENGSYTFFDYGSGRRVSVQARG